jgi:arabinogalactan oligomer/maltooligosaccharide transport system substrate-binding protein
MNQFKRLAALTAGVVLVVAACGPGASPSPSQPAASEPVTSPAASEGGTQPSALSGKLTFWHSYSSGGGETGALNEALAKIKADNPDFSYIVVDQPFSDIFNLWQTSVLAGETSPDLFIAPNDNLYSQATAGALLDVTDKMTGKLDGFSQVAIDGSKVGGKFYMVPESLKAVALWYDKTAIANPPATTADLLTAVQSGTMKLGLHQDPYFQFGFSGAFGGTLMDDTGKCVADQAGWADAYKYAADLKKAGAKFYTDGNAMKQDFQTGALNAVVDGPWQTADFKAAYETLGHDLGVAAMPAGPSGGKANPLTGTDGWYINPNSPNVDLAVNFALMMVSTQYEQLFTNDGGHVPAAPNVTISDPLVQGFADAAASGLPRPQNAQLNNYWGNFGNALNEVLDKGADPGKAIGDACKAMNDANGL